jgi:putative ABC transport system permease protein
MQSYNLGIDMEQVLVLKTPRRIENIATHIQSLKTELLKQTDIKSVSVTSIVPGLENTQVGGGFRLKGQDKSFDKQCYSVQIDYDFQETFGVELLAGSMFSEDHGNEYGAVILNEASVGLLGIENPEAAIGQQVINPHRGNEPMQIIGVVKNFHQLSLKDPINPTVMTLSDAASFISVKLSTEDIGNTIEGIEKQWLSIFPNEPFDHSFLNEDFQHQYQEDIYFARIFALFSGLSIVIACLGLFGLAAYSVQKRTKEIGIRKVLGASISTIMVLISKKYLLMMLLSTLIATPFTYWVMQSWLDNFSYHIEIGIWVFILSGSLCILIALLTVSHHAIRASMANPLDSLKNE